MWSILKVRSAQLKETQSLLALQLVLKLSKRHQNYSTLRGTTDNQLCDENTDPYRIFLIFDIKRNARVQIGYNDFSEVQHTKLVNCHAPLTVLEASAERTCLRARILFRWVSTATRPRVDILDAANIPCSQNNNNNMFQRGRWFGQGHNNATLIFEFYIRSEKPKFQKNSITTPYLCHLSANDALERCYCTKIVEIEALLCTPEFKNDCEMDEQAVEFLWIVNHKKARTRIQVRAQRERVMAKLRDELATETTLSKEKQNWHNGLHEEEGPQMRPPGHRREWPRTTTVKEKKRRRKSGRKRRKLSIYRFHERLRTGEQAQWESPIPQTCASLTLRLPRPRTNKNVSTCDTKARGRIYVQETRTPLYHDWREIFALNRFADFLSMQNRIEILGSGLVDRSMARFFRCHFSIMIAPSMEARHLTGKNKSMSLSNLL